MRHLKKLAGILGLLMLCSVLSISLTSCGDDEPNEKNDGNHDSSLIGTWVNSDPDYGWTKITFNTNGTGRIEEVEYEDDSENKYWCEFNWSASDGYMVLEVTNHDDTDGDWDDVMTFRYSVVNNRLYLNGDPDAPFIKQK